MHFVMLSVAFLQSETEWQHFLRQNLEAVAKIAELAPANTFKSVVSKKYIQYLEYLASNA